MNPKISMHPSTPPPLWSSQPGRVSERSPAKLDPERGDKLSQKQHWETSPTSSTTGGGSSRWNLFRKPKHSYQEIDSLRIRQIRSVPANGDSDGRITGFYNTVASSLTVDLLFTVIIPVEVVLWIPGIVQLTVSHGAQILGVLLTWWSAWLTVLWLGWWLSSAASRVLPGILRSTVRVITPRSRQYIDWIEILQRYIATTTWTAISWITFQAFIVGQQSSTAGSTSKTDVGTISRLTFGFFLCTAVLLLEKLCIQWAARVFHKRAYAERIADQNRAVEILAILYRHSVQLDPPEDGKKVEQKSPAPKKSVGTTTRRRRSVSNTTTTVFRNSISQLVGSSEVPADSPQCIIRKILCSADQTQSLARQIFYSFAKSGAQSLVVEDISGIFPTKEEANTAFAFLDQDGNGDCTSKEVEITCMECHRQRLSIEHSMWDMDTAVGRLDNILMTVYMVVAIMIIAVALNANLASVITGVGTLVLGTSWLIGTSLAEILISMIFLFFKYPYDVGDMVVVDEIIYTVREIRLLNTVLLDPNHAFVFAPNALLNGKFILNVRRSPRMSETFTFDVAYDTTFEQIEVLRERMLAFLSGEARDYIRAFNVEVVDFPGQTKMTLAVDIKYKSNIQPSGLKATRRNKWVCALKTCLADVNIFGPTGDPHGITPPARHTLVPWEDVADADRKRETQYATTLRTGVESQPVCGWNLTDQHAALVDDSRDVFGGSHEYPMTRVQSVPSSSSYVLRQKMARDVQSPTAYPRIPPTPAYRFEDIEMNPNSLQQ